MRRERQLRGPGRDADMQLSADDDGRPVRAVPAVRAGGPVRAESVRRQRPVPARTRQHRQGAAGVHVSAGVRGRRADPVPARRVFRGRRVPARPGVRRLPVQERVRRTVRRGRGVQRAQPRGHLLVPARLHGRRVVPVLSENRRLRRQPAGRTHLLQQKVTTATTGSTPRHRSACSPSLTRNITDCCCCCSSSSSSYCRGERVLEDPKRTFFYSGYNIKRTFRFDEHYYPTYCCCALING